MPFTAEEYYTTDPPGFVWTASIDFTGGIPVSGQDRYIEGAAALEMRLFGVIPVASDSGPEMDEGDLLRYLNETMWFPAGVLSPYITWESVDDTSARATMDYEGSRGSGTFYFDEEGRITNMIADRFDREYGAIVPWSTPLQELRRVRRHPCPDRGRSSLHAGHWRLCVHPLARDGDRLRRTSPLPGLAGTSTIHRRGRIGIDDYLDPIPETLHHDHRRSQDPPRPSSEVVTASPCLSRRSR